jgi:hypothetical protein
MVTLTPSNFSLGEKSPNTHCIGALMGLKFDLDTVKKRK